MVAEEVSGGNDEVIFQFRAEKLDKKVCKLVVCRFQSLLIMIVIIIVL